MANRTYSLMNSSKFGYKFRNAVREFSCSNQGKNYHYVRTLSHLADVYDNNSCAIIVRNSSIVMVGPNRTKLNNIRRNLVKKMGADLQIIK